MNKRIRKKYFQKLCLQFCMTAYINSFVDVKGDYRNVPGILVSAIKQIPLFSVFSTTSIEKMFRKGFCKTFYYAKKGLYWDGLLPVWKQTGLINYLGETILNFISKRWENNMKHLEWKNFHSEILFSLLSRNYTVSDLRVPEEFYGQFYRFIGLNDKEINIFCSDLESNDYTMNEKQTFLFIQNGTNGLLFENNLDTNKSDEKELAKVYNQIVADNTKVLKVVRIFWNEKDYENISCQLENTVFISASKLANFFENWCNSQKEESLAKGMYSQYAKKLRNNLKWRMFEYLPTEKLQIMRKQGCL